RPCASGTAARRARVSAILDVTAEPTAAASCPCATGPIAPANATRRTRPLSMSGRIPVGQGRRSRVGTNGTVDAAGDGPAGPDSGPLRPIVRDAGRHCRARVERGDLELERAVGARPPTPVPYAGRGLGERTERRAVFVVPRAEQNRLASAVEHEPVQAASVFTEHFEPV